ncbi:hypothetical protein [Spirosoma koreense]
MDNESVKQDLYQVIHEFVALNQAATNDTITALFTSIRVFTDELPVYPNPQTTAQTSAYELAHSESEADLMLFSDEAEFSTAERATALAQLQARATEIERLLRSDPVSSAI